VCVASQQRLEFWSGNPPDHRALRRWLHEFVASPAIAGTSAIWPPEGVTINRIGLRAGGVARATLEDHRGRAWAGCPGESSATPSTTPSGPAPTVPSCDARTGEAPAAGRAWGLTLGRAGLGWVGRPLRHAFSDARVAVFVYVSVKLMARSLAR
jgi:hypothetical protein